MFCYLKIEPLISTAISSTSDDFAILHGYVSTVAQSGQTKHRLEGEIPTF